MTNAVKTWASDPESRSFGRRCKESIVLLQNTSKVGSEISLPGLHAASRKPTVCSRQNLYGQLPVAKNGTHMICIGPVNNTVTCESLCLSNYQTCI